METDWKHDKWFNGKALIRKAREVDSIHYCQLGKMDVFLHVNDLPFFSHQKPTENRAIFKIFGLISLNGN